MATMSSAYSLTLAQFFSSLSTFTTSSPYSLYSIIDVSGISAFCSSPLLTWSSLALPLTIWARTIMLRSLTTAQTPAFARFLALPPFPVSFSTSTIVQSSSMCLLRSVGICKSKHALCSRESIQQSEPTPALSRSWFPNALVRPCTHSYSQEWLKPQKGDVFVWVGQLGQIEIPWKQLQARGVFTIYYQTEPREACDLHRSDGIDEVWDYSWHNIEVNHISADVCHALL